MQRKYQLTDKTKTLSDGTVLYRIQALRDGPWGPAGTFGGWVQTEENLSHYGNCWVSNEAQIYEYALVSTNAKVFDNAEVFGRAWVTEKAEVFGNAKIFEKAQGAGTAKVHGNAQIFGDACVYGDTTIWEKQKVNGECILNGYEKDQKFQVHDICICNSGLTYLEKYHGCAWIISAAHEGWVQAKHGKEEIAFRNNWLRKV